MRRLLPLVGVVAGFVFLGPTASAYADLPGPECSDPSFTGTPQQGSTLTGSAGTCFPEATSITLRWRRCDSVGSNCVDIPGASGSEPLERLLTADDAGHVLELRQEASNALGDDVASTQTPLIEGAPRAGFAISPATPATGQLVSFTSTSSDPDGDALAFGWELDGDHDFDDATGASASRSYSAAGAKTVSLRVTDSDGNSSTATRTFTVVAPRQTEGTSSAGQTVFPLNPPPPVQPRVGPRLMSPFPVVIIAGRLTRRGARLSRLVVRGPRGARVTVRCKGRGCPARRQAKRIGRQRKVRFRRFERRLRAGTKIGVYVRKRGLIGKYTRFRIRRGKRPARVDRCLLPGSKRPRRCRGR